jgi:hypothetical protein
MKTLLVSIFALTLNVGTFINVEMAFSILVALGVLFIVAHDYTPHHLVKGMEV